MSDAAIQSLITIIPSLLTIFLIYRQGGKLETVHSLVNSQMGVQLQLNAANSQWRADESGKPEDIQAADQAQSLLSTHTENQAKVDAK